MWDDSLFKGLEWLGCLFALGMWAIIGWVVFFVYRWITG